MKMSSTIIAVSPDVLEAFNRGVALLDEHYPGWNEYFDEEYIENLDVQVGDRCILARIAQETIGLFAAYYDIADKIVPEYRTSRYGFASLVSEESGLNQLWRDLIRERNAL